MCVPMITAALFIMAKTASQVSMDGSVDKANVVSAYSETSGSPTEERNPDICYHMAET